MLCVRACTDDEQKCLGKVREMFCADSARLLYGLELYMAEHKLNGWIPIQRFEWNFFFHFIVLNYLQYQHNSQYFRQLLFEFFSQLIRDFFPLVSESVMWFCGIQKDLCTLVAHCSCLKKRRENSPFYLFALALVLCLIAWINRTIETIDDFTQIDNTWRGIVCVWTWQMGHFQEYPHLISHFPCHDAWGEFEWKNQFSIASLCHLMTWYLWKWIDIQWMLSV